MFKKLLAASAVSMVLAGAAFAQSSPGFEAGTAGWVPPNSTLTTQVVGELKAQTYGTDVTVVQDVYIGGAYDHSHDRLFNVTSAGAAYGNSFGVLGTGTLSNGGYRVSLLDSPSSAGDLFALQLFSFDADTLGGYVDSATISFYQGSTEFSKFVAFSDDSYDAGNGNGNELNGATSFTGASGWYQVAVPTGTTSISVMLANGPLDDTGNQPLVALDYAAVTPVPEPESLALMMAGLGAVGFMSRRRQVRATK
jgi:PEP-CTERM motif